MWAGRLAYTNTINSTGSSTSNINSNSNNNQHHQKHEFDSGNFMNVQDNTIEPTHHHLHLQNIQNMNNMNNEDWYLSTTAANHVTNNSHRVYDYVSLTTFDENNVMDNHHQSYNNSNVQGVGKLQVMFRDTTDQSTFVTKTTLDQVLVIPGSKNLISVGRLVRSGQIVFNTDGKVLFEGYTIAISVNGVYKMSVSRAPPFSSPPPPVPNLTVNPLFNYAANNNGTSNDTSSYQQRMNQYYNTKSRSFELLNFNPTSSNTNAWSQIPPNRMTPPLYTHEYWNAPTTTTTTTTTANPFDFSSLALPTVATKNINTPLISTATNNNCNTDDCLAFISASNNKNEPNSGGGSNNSNNSDNGAPTPTTAGIIGDKPPSPQTTPTIASRKPSTMELNSNIIAITIEQWHLRLGHLDYEIIRELCTNNVIVLTEEEANRWDNIAFSCECCEAAKVEVATAKIGDPSIAEVALKSNQPLELIHASLCGPLKQRGMCGLRYFLIIVDDFSRYTFILPIATTNEAGHRIVEFIEVIESLAKPLRVMGLKVTQICRNKRLIDFARNSDVLHLQTVPNRPQMKGVAERTKRVLLKSAIAIRESCSSTNHNAACIWDEAVRHAAALRNRCPNRATGSVPVDRFLSRIVTNTNNNELPTTTTASALTLAEYASGVFGCDVLNSNHEEMGMFMGYDKQGYYRIFNPAVKEVSNVHYSLVHLTTSFDVFNKYQKVFYDYSTKSHAAPLVPLVSVLDIMPL